MIPYVVVIYLPDILFYFILVGRRLRLEVEECDRGMEGKTSSQ